MGFVTEMCVCVYLQSIMKVALFPILFWQGFYLKNKIDKRPKKTLEFSHMFCVRQQVGIQYPLIETKLSLYFKGRCHLHPVAPYKILKPQIHNAPLT